MASWTRDEKLAKLDQPQYCEGGCSKCLASNCSSISILLCDYKLVECFVIPEGLGPGGNQSLIFLNPNLLIARIRALPQHSGPADSAFPSSEGLRTGLRSLVARIYDTAA